MPDSSARSSSSSADTVTRCGVSQSSASNTRLDGESSTPAPSGAAIATVTGPEGSVSSATVYDALPPSSSISEASETASDPGSHAAVSETAVSGPLLLLPSVAASAATVTVTSSPPVGVIVIV